MLDRLGVTIHPSKSALEPVQRIEYLASILDSRDMFISVPERKVVNIKACARLSKKELHVQ